MNIAAKNSGVKNFDRDNMGSDELIANLFSISLTEQKIKNESIKLDKEANKAHYEVGKDIRETKK